MVEARPAMAGDIDAVCDLLHRKMNPKIPARGWRPLMTYDWLADKPDLGAVTVDGGRIVGYLGVIYADRQRHGRRFRTGNLTSWYLEKPYRGTGAGLELLRVATRHADVVYTTFSSTARALILMRRYAGLRQLDGERCVWQRREANPASSIGIVHGAENVLPLLDDEEKRLLADHADFAVDPYAICSDRGICLVLLSIHQKAGEIASHEALYVGNREIFASAAQVFADSILPVGSAVLEVDKRFLGDLSAGAETGAIRVPRHFRPIPGVDAPDIDFLYSEIELLNLKLW